MKILAVLFGMSIALIITYSIKGIVHLIIKRNERKRNKKVIDEYHRNKSKGF
jgi:hypothetical protein